MILPVQFLISTPIAFLRSTLMPSDTILLQSNTPIESLHFNSESLSKSIVFLPYSVKNPTPVTHLEVNLSGSTCKYIEPTTRWVGSNECSLQLIYFWTGRMPIQSFFHRENSNKLQFFLCLLSIHSTYQIHTIQTHETARWLSLTTCDFFVHFTIESWKHVLILSHTSLGLCSPFLLNSATRRSTKASAIERHKYWSIIGWSASLKRRGVISFDLHV